MSGRANESRLHKIEQMLAAAGLAHCFRAIKGGTSAVQLQHVAMLKEKARQGPSALETALAESGIESADDRAKLAAILAQLTQAREGLAMKSAPAPKGPADTHVWKREVIDAGGELADEATAASRDVVESDPAGNAPAAANGTASGNSSGTTAGWPPGMKIVNDHYVAGNGGSLREQGKLKEPSPRGFIHLAGEVEHPRLFRKPSAAKAALLASLKAAAAHLSATEADVREATVFNAFIIPPGSEEGRHVLAKSNFDVHIAEFDVAVLVECTDLAAAQRVRQSAAFAALKQLLDDKADFVHCITATNPKRIDDVDHSRDGVFLFNYFFAADVVSKGAAGIDILLGVWEYTAGWWTARANLTNSVPMMPAPGERSEYSLINHCRWNRAIDIVPHLIVRPSLNAFVLKNFTANDIMAMPVLYRLA